MLIHISLLDAISPQHWDQPGVHRGEERGMTYTSLSERFTKLAARPINSSRFIALAIIAAVTLGAMQPAQHQSSDTGKSIAIIGGINAAVADLRHEVGGA